MKIEQPGIYPAFPVDDYFADPCPTPSLTQSVAKILLERSPLHAWHAHPRLNPDFVRDEDRKFDVGNIAHKLMLGRGKEITVLAGFDDWKTKAAREAREAAAAVGTIAVLSKHFDLAAAMVEAARRQLEERGRQNLFGAGDPEAVLAWSEGNIWLRQMVDWLSTDRLTFVDYKTTDLSVAPHNIPRMMVNASWPIQAAMAERGLRALKGQAHRALLFVAQETEPPYSIAVVEMSEDVLTMGRKQLAYAIGTWAHCMRESRWPGYPTETLVPEYPGWAEQQWLDREVKEAARGRLPSFDPNILMAG